jgi:hypothetical protein
LPLPLALALTLAADLAPRSARADVTSWLAVGGGAGIERNHDTGKSTSDPAMTYSIGVGSSPAATLVVGGIVRGNTLFNRGTDLGVAARVCTGGFARGDWGLALDAGAIWRPWLSQYGAWPLQGVITGGSPWGLQLALGANVSSVSGGVPAQGFFAAIELDLLRLTVMRQGRTTERWWYNPAPAGGHIEESASAGER